MVVFTVFFCGTSSNSFDFTHPNYHQGELVSTLARNHSGMEFVDWVLADGPGSGNYQVEMNWTTNTSYSEKRGQMFGTGWDENVQHAMAVLKSRFSYSNPTYTAKQVEKLKQPYEPEKFPAGVPEGITPRQVPSWFGWSTKKGARITPQELQQNKVKIFRKGVITTVNMIGWSRGAVTCHMLANAMRGDPDLSGLAVNIFACDPVPGLGSFQTNRTNLGSNVVNYHAVFARDERTKGFDATRVELHGATSSLMMTLPGRHATLAGNAFADGESGGEATALTGPGLIVRWLAEKSLSSWGTPLSGTLGLGTRDVLKLYDRILGNEAEFVKMRKNVYAPLYGTFGQERWVSVGQAWQSSKISTLDRLGADEPFVNWQHRALFRGEHPEAYRYAFDGVGRELALVQLLQYYPHTIRKIRAAQR